MLCGMDWAAMRTAFRQERERRVGSRAKLVELASQADESKLDESTVFRIETDELYMPGLDTFAKLIEAMPGLTLSEFFLRIEGLPTPARGVTDQRSSPQATDENRPVSADSFVQQEFLAALAKQFIAAVERVVETRTKNRRPRSAKPARRRRTGSTR